MTIFRLTEKTALFFMLILAVFWSGCTKKNSDEEQIRVGYETADTAQERKLPHTAHRFDFQGYAFEVLPPDGFMMKEMCFDDMKLISLYRKENSYNNSAVINISIYIPPNSSETTTSTLESMLKPYQKRCVNYVRTEKQPFTNNMLTFEGASFTGLLDTFALRGTIYVTKKE